MICSYLFICFFRSFFLLKIPFVESYHLYPHHTDVYALSFNAYYLCRLQFSLCYHYFTLLQMDDRMYETIALSSILGKMKTIPFLGKEFNFYMPLIVVIISLFTLFKMLFVWKRKAKKEDLLLESVDEEKAGRDLVALTVKRRQRMLLDRSSSRNSQNMQYQYHSPTVDAHSFSPIPEV